MRITRNMVLIRYVYLTLYGAVKYLPTPFGDVLRYAILKPFCRELRTMWIHEGVTVHWPENVRIGRRAAINEFVFINGFGTVTIGDNVGIGTGAKLLSAEHRCDRKDIPFIDQPIEPRAIVIQEDVQIGMNAIILGGCTVGKGAVVAAGSVVAKDVPEYAVVMGFPARVLHYR